jgi:uncharacterized protein (DUF1697 family)
VVVSLWAGARVVAAGGLRALFLVPPAAPRYLRTMPSYVSLLRGINVSGRNRIAMADLRALFEAHGHHDVTTYVQSGNVVSRSSTRGAGAVARAIQRAIADDLGLDVTVLVRTPAELHRILEGNPFLGPGADVAKLHVTFLGEPAAATRAAALDGGAFAPDRFAVHGREVYVHCPDGYGRTKINNTFFERKLGVTATTRNWNTVTQLAELAGG